MPQDKLEQRARDFIAGRGYSPLAEMADFAREVLKEAAEIAERYKYGKDAAQAIRVLME